MPLIEKRPMDSSQPRELPGFYYDVDRKRYFPLTATVKREQKKRQLQASREDKIDAAWKSAVNEYRKVKRLLYFSGSTETEQLMKRRLLAVANFLRLRAAGPVQKYVLDIASSDIDHNHLGRKILQSCCLYGGLTNLVFLSNGNILRYDRKMNIRGEYYWKMTHEYSELRWSRTGSRSCKIVRLIHRGSDIFCCYEYETLNSSDVRNQGWVTYRDGRTLACTLLKNLESNNEEHKQPRQLIGTFPLTSGDIGSPCDSVAIPGGFVMSSGNEIRVFNWNDSGHQANLLSIKKVITGEISVITCLGVVTYKEGKSILYSGFRDGRIFSIAISHNGVFGKPKPFQVTELPKVDSIVSIHTLPTGGLLVSVISKELENEQLLCLCRPSGLYRKGKTTVRSIRLSTKFQNVTKDTEILSVSRDGSLIVYGKKYVNDYEVFSMDYVQQEPDKTDECIAYPIAHMADYFSSTNDIDLSEYRLTNVEIVGALRRSKTVILDVNCCQEASYYEQYSLNENTNVDTNLQDGQTDTLSLTFEKYPVTDRESGTPEPIVKIFSVPIF